MLTKTSRNYWKPGLRDAQDAGDILSAVRENLPGVILQQCGTVAQLNARDLVTLYREWPLTVTRALQGAR